MSGSFNLRDLGRTPTIPGVLIYLSLHGWTYRQNGLLIRCEGPTDDEGQPIVVFLPASEKYSDYPLRLEELIHILSLIEERPAVEIVHEMGEVGPWTAESLLDEFKRSAVGVFSIKRPGDLLSNWSRS